MKKEEIEKSINNDEKSEEIQLDNQQEPKKRRRSGNSKPNKNLSKIILIVLIAIIIGIIFFILNNKEDKTEVVIENNFKEIEYKKVESGSSENKTSVQEEVLAELEKEIADKNDNTVKEEVTEENNKKDNKQEGISKPEKNQEPINRELLVGVIGDTLEVSNLAYTLLDYSVIDSIGEDMYKIEAENGSKLLLFDVKIENIGDKDSYLMDNNLYVISENNVHYVVDYFIAGNEYIGLNLDAIVPESDKYVKMYTKVPEELLNNNLELYIKSKDGSKTVQFQLELNN